MPVAGRQETRAPRRFGGLLRHRDFRLLWIGESVSAVGNAMAVVGVPLLAVSVLHASTFAVAALTAAAYLPWLVIGLPAGAWVDRLPARPLMITCDATAALLYASLPVSAWLGVLTTGQVIAVALLAGVANVFFATAYQVYLPALVAADDLIEGNAKLQGTMQVANIGGRAAAGLAAQAVGAAAALLFNAASFLVSAACLVLIRTKSLPGQPGRTTSIRAEIAAGVRSIAADPYLRPMTIYAAVSNLAYAGETSLVIVFLVRVAGFGAGAVGLLLATGAVGGVLGALVARRVARRFGTARTLLLSSLVASLPGLLIPLTAAGPRAVYYIVGSMLVAVGIAVSNIIAASFRQTYCPAHMLGRATATMRFLSFGAVPLGALLAGGLGTVLTVRNALWVMLAINAASCALLFTRALRAAVDLPRTPAARQPG